tara:strand:+ start:1434 stop:2105 length:672 start_codon:yes stop_codon:yes gene_type:complete
MKNIKEIIRDLSEYDSATVQNAMILIRGFTPETQDYTGPSLKSFYLEKPVVGISITAKVTPLNIQKTVIDWDNYYDEVSKCDLPVIGVLQDIEKDKGRAAIMGDGMAHKHKALGAVGVIAEGSIRDLPGIIQAKCPVWGTGRVPGHGPFNLIETQTPVEVANLSINPNDLLIGDGDGITRIPLEIAEETLKVCKEVRLKESKIINEFRKKNYKYKGKVGLRSL